MKRLIQAGLELQFYPAAFAEMAAENIRTGVVGSLSVQLAWLQTNGNKCSVQQVQIHYDSKLHASSMLHRDRICCSNAFPLSHVQVEGSIPLMLGIDPVPPPFLAWADIAPQQVRKSTHTAGSNTSTCLPHCGFDSMELLCLHQSSSSNPVAYERCSTTAAQTCSFGGNRSVLVMWGVAGCLLLALITRHTLAPTVRSPLQIRSCKHWCSTTGSRA